MATLSVKESFKKVYREPNKARHYIDLLDAARCNRQWQEVPELTRKIAKHAPQRHCLVLTAQTEHRVASLLSQPSPTAASTNSHILSETIPLLRAASEQENAFKEDAFQAQICSAWIHMTLEDWVATIATLATDLSVALESIGKANDALRSYESMLPYISSAQSSVGTSPEHRLWSERLLARHCMLVHRHVAVTRILRTLLADGSGIELAAILKPYRAWADFWDEKHSRSVGQHSGLDIENDSLRTRTWKGYYDTISVLIHHQIVNPVFDSRLQQAFELKRVEATYESILLNEVKFPKADQATPEIENWVDQVMANWRALLGPAWSEEDLGSGGRAALGRGVLEILYRAATRSFHSTRVLRHLFTVHAALAEFSLAGKALDSYLEITTKGKARIEKSGEIEHGLDDDATALSTAASGILMLCMYGNRREAERAQEIAKIVEDWVQKVKPDQALRNELGAEDSPKALEGKPRLARPPVSGKALAQAHHAIGISNACWARLTYEISSRADLQASAISNFRRALRWDLDDEDNIQTLYSLTFVLAETRDIDGAITAAKQAISIGTKSITSGIGTHIDLRDGNTDQELRIDPDQRGLLLRCWHILILLLSARQSFSTALAACEAALEPYGGKAVFYGDTRPLGSVLGLDLCEKKNLVELKMTHLALLEVLEGPEESVNASGELLGLYTKLFQPAEKTKPKTPGPRPVSPNMSTRETQRSLRGSILGLPKDHRKSRPHSGGITSGSIRSFEPPAEDSTGPTISVTMNGNSTLPQNPNHHQDFLGRHETNKLQKRPSRKSMTSVRTSRAGSPSKPPTAEGHHRISLHLPTRHRQHNQTARDGSRDPSVYERVFENASYSPDEIGVAMTHDMPSAPDSPQFATDTSNPLLNIPSAAQNMNHKNPNPYPILPKPPPSAAPIPPSISIPAPTTIPEPNYPSHMRDRHALSLLTKIWLFVSSLYRHASMLTDSQGAISEARSQVEAVEQSIASHEGSSAENLSSPGYGGLKSCGELWADVLDEQAALYLAQGNSDQASDAYETALTNCLDHLPATVGLSNMLLDFYATPQQPDSRRKPTDPLKPAPILASLPTSSSTDSPVDFSTSPDRLMRLSARDRAYGLLSTLTQSGHGWDSSGAWFALARAYEESRQTEKAKEAFWWVVELEEGRGVRQWNCIV
ncbi:MAG: hypothetical protein Q9217_000823 [Psora testacea]